MFPQRIESWRDELGLFPVPLLPYSSERNAYVLLNGARGSFCLETEPQLDPVLDRRSEAWSANVGYFLTIGDDELLVEGWDQPPGTVIRRSLAEVADSPQDFYSLLEHSAPSPDLSVISHFLRVFRSLRGSVERQVTGEDALQGFLVLLAATVDNVHRRSVDLRAWGLDGVAAEIADAIEDDVWADLCAELIQGAPLQKLRPDLRILLRHASGPLFQEAHYFAHYTATVQRVISGIAVPPAPVGIIRETDAVGLHFTPPSLARTLVEEALEAYGALPQTITVLDPACGSGEFLRETVRQLILRGFEGGVRVVGWDTSPAACAMARFILAWETRNQGDIRFEIERRNALEYEWPQVDLIIMNPPFVSIRDMSAEVKQLVEMTLGDHARGRLDLSSAFIWKAVSSLSPGGVLATILPASFLSGQSFARLRGTIGEILSPHLIARLGSQEIFQQAQVDSGLYVGRRAVGTRSPLAVWADHRLSSNSIALRTLRRIRALNSTSAPVVGDGFSVFLHPSIGLDENDWSPRPFREWMLRQKAEGLPKVSDCFTVRQGALTGLNRVFLISQHDWEALPSSERVYFRPAIINESISDGRIIATAYIFYPYGEYKLSTEHELKRHVPTFYSGKLGPQKSMLTKRKISKATKWWELTRHRVWQLTRKPKLISKYFGEKGSFAWDEFGDYIVVQGYGWHLRGWGRSPDRAIWLAYLALLNSDIFEDLLSATSDNVGGGQWNLSIRFVEKIPMPRLPISGESSRLTGQLAKIGEMIRRLGVSGLTPAARDELNELAETAYGLVHKSESG